MTNDFTVREFQGLWLPFHGDRHELRSRIEHHLQKELSDPEGALVVNERGPHWKGRVPLAGLSYSHTTGQALLCYSLTHELGVDVEKSDRPFAKEPSEIAARFFHPEEVKRMKSREAFLTLWIQKEAYAKLTREGLQAALGLDLTQFLISNESLGVKKIAKVPVGYEAWVAFREPR